MSDPKILKIVVVGEFEDGKVRQIILKPETEEKILNFIGKTEGKIKVLETPIENLTIEKT